ncbi:MAG: hypothetical protein ACR2NA_09430 [Solirubrobacterales bacterium]
MPARNGKLHIRAVTALFVAAAALLVGSASAFADTGGAAAPGSEPSPAAPQSAPAGDVSDADKAVARKYYLRAISSKRSTYTRAKAGCRTRASAAKRSSCRRAALAKYRKAKADAKEAYLYELRTGEEMPHPTKATISRNRRTALAPANAPQAVKDTIRWANRITRKPYRYGGGHGRFSDSGYDCSGAISYALRGAKLVSSPLDSRSFASWGERGVGEWITVYTNPGHAYVVIAGLRFDTSSAGAGGGKGPRWRSTSRSPSSFTARHAERL